MMRTTETTCWDTWRSQGRVALLFDFSNKNIKHIQKHSVPDIPSWCVTKPTILFDLHNNKNSILEESLIMGPSYMDLLEKSYLHVLNIFIIRDFVWHLEHSYISSIELLRWGRWATVMGTQRKAVSSITISKPTKLATFFFLLSSP